MAGVSRHFHRLLFTVAFCAHLLMGVDARGETWRVAKDGSGDFTVIQDAVDVAAPGDTIAIAAGRYSDFRAFDPGTGVGPYTIVGIDKEGICLRGASRDSVIVGPLDPVPEVDGTVTNCISIGPSLGKTYISGITLEHAFNLSELLSAAEWTDVRFRSSDQLGVVVLDGDGHRFDGCVFLDEASVQFFGSNIADVQVIESRFQGASFLNFQGSSDVLVQRCQFLGNSIDVQFVQGATGSVDDCLFLGDTSFSQLAVSTRARVQVTRSRFVGNATRRVLVTSRGSGIRATNNVFEGADTATIELLVTEPADAVFQGNAILNAGGWSVDAVIGLEDPRWVDLASIRQKLTPL